MFLVFSNIPEHPSKFSICTFHTKKFLLVKISWGAQDHSHHPSIFRCVLWLSKKNFNFKFKQKREELKFRTTTLNFLFDVHTREQNTCPLLQFPSIVTVPQDFACRHSEMMVL